MTDKYFDHYSVLKNECLSFMEGSLLADLTFGGGGHTLEIARKNPDALVYATDQDGEAYANGIKKIEANDLSGRIKLLKMNFEIFPNWCHENNVSNFDGILMDLGVSSHHFDKFERGFSFKESAPLDMRMNEESDLTAEDVLNNETEEDIANIIYKYGEERYSRKIAKSIIEYRKENGAIKTTKELENIVFHAYPKHERYKKTHPATKTFQAIRIYVNRELEVLENTIAKLYELLAPSGRLAIISFHSLEDRIVKHSFKDIFQNNKKTAKILTKKPIYPSVLEVEENNRSRSAKLRVIQKIG